MPKVRIDDTLNLYYELDDYTDPWTTPETILLIHGVADTSRAWFAWVPQLARRFRVYALTSGASASPRFHHHTISGPWADWPRT